ncbi:MAG: hypothetical protein MUF56_06215 [Solirubrobacteraceae bacterium]|nr:hypothetical protein [Solirubrobacteraceae bacterium]
MGTEATTETHALAAENARLRERVDELERERAELVARTSRLVADAEERTYWLERWQLDLNALMRRPGAAQFRALLRAARWPVRQAKLLARRIRGGA